MKTSTRRISGIGIAATGILLGISGLGVSPAAGAPNPGSVHVGGVVETPGNDPKLDCEIVVEFRDFPTGALGDLTFSAQAPTGSGGTLLFVDDVVIGADPDPTLTVAFDELDATQFTGTHAEGYKVKLDVVVFEDGVEVKNGAKSKAFWVTECADEEDQGGDDQGGDDQGGDDQGGDDQGGDDQGGDDQGGDDQGGDDQGGDDQGDVLENETEKPAAGPAPAPIAPRPAKVLPSSFNRSAAAGAEVAGVTTLPRTGTDTLPLAQVGFGMVLLGAAAIFAGRSEQANA